METLHRELRVVLRNLRRSPAFAAVVVLTLALGVGATTALYSVVDGVLLRPLPYPEPERIVHLWQVNAGSTGATNVSDPNFADWQARTRSFAAMAQVANRGAVSVVGGAEPVRAAVASVSRDYFTVMGVRPLVGRGFLPEEQQPGAPPAVIVSHAFWQAQLGGAPSLRGRTLTFGDRVHAVVGVMPPTFDHPAGAALWTPRELEPVRESRTAHNWQVVARLRDGVTTAAAAQELGALSRRMKAEHGEETWMVDATLVPLREQLVGHTRPALLVLLGASALLLLIAGANVTNLLLARAATRQGEIAVRLALGAGRARLAAQFLTEALVLALAGGALGILLAVAGLRLLLAVEPGQLPRVGEVGVRWSVLAFAVAVSVLTAVAVGLFTAWRGTQGDVRDALSQSQRTQAGSGASQRLRGALAVTQVALTLVLLVGAGLLARSFVRLAEVDPGFRTRGAVLLDLSLPPVTDSAAAARQLRTHAELTARLSRLPGVRAVGGTNALPLQGRGASGTFLIMRRVDEPLAMADLPRLMRDPSRTGYAEFRVADGGYFGAMGIPLVQGRLFEPRDDARAPHVALVSQSLASTRWPGQDAVGRVIQFGNMDGDLTPFTVVGVVGDVRDASLAAEPKPTFYANARQRPTSASEFTLVLHTEADPAAVIPAARRIVRELAPEVPPRLRTLDTVVAASLADRRFNLVLLGVFGGAALLLAVLGVYSVIAYLVTQRRREIGVRIAIGATSADVLRFVVAQGARLALAGVAIGVLAALAAGRLLEGMLYGVSATDPVAYAAVALLLLGIALAASWLPARRATRVHPMTVLREG